MMISPASYIEHLQDAGYLELIEERDRLLRFIKEYLTINPYYTDPSNTKTIKQPLTKAGKSPKYSSCFQYVVFGNKKRQSGEVWLLPDGSIGKAKMITWIEYNGFQIYLSVIDGLLTVNKVETINTSKRNGKWEVLYKSDNHRETI